MGAVRLPRLSTAFSIAGSSLATAAFSKLWDQLCTAIEGAVNSIQTQEDEQASQLVIIQRIIQSLSYTEGLTITAMAEATDATINISACNRIYLDIPAVAVDAGSITGVPFSTDALIYYDDLGRAGGAVTFHYTTDPNQAATSDANPGRVFVGEVIAPANAAAPPNPGIPPRPPTHGIQP